MIQLNLQTNLLWTTYNGGPY